MNCRRKGIRLEFVSYHEFAQIGGFLAKIGGLPTKIEGHPTIHTNRD